MRLGVYGGTFDPIHLGHLILAENCREACQLDAVWFVVAGAPPHKPGDRTNVSDRLEMVRIAVAGHPSFSCSEVEARGPGPHYSAETLEEIARDRPEDELFFLIGGDSLADLPQWRRPSRIAELATIVVANRPDSAPGRRLDSLAEILGPSSRLDPQRLDPPHRHRLPHPPRPAQGRPERAISDSAGGGGVYRGAGVVSVRGAVFGSPTPSAPSAMSGWPRPAPPNSVSSPIDPAGPSTVSDVGVSWMAGLSRASFGRLGQGAQPRRRFRPIGMVDRSGRPATGRDRDRSGRDDPIRFDPKKGRGDRPWRQPRTRHGPWR